VGAAKRHFRQRYRAITYAARGYPPRVAGDVAKYSQARGGRYRFGAGFMKIDKPMSSPVHGGFATLHFGFRHAARAKSLVSPAAAGLEPVNEEVSGGADAIAKFIDDNDIAVSPKNTLTVRRGAIRKQRPARLAEFKQHCRNTQIGARKPSLASTPSTITDDLVGGNETLTVPTLF